MNKSVTIINMNNTERMRSAFQCYERSRTDEELRGKILAHIPSELYELWDGLDIELVLENLTNLTLDFRLSASVFLFHSVEAGERDHLLGKPFGCPSLKDMRRPFEVFEERSLVIQPKRSDKTPSIVITHPRSGGKLRSMAILATALMTTLPEVRLVVCGTETVANNFRDSLPPDLRDRVVFNNTPMKPT